MKQTRLIMGMPITIEIIDESRQADLDVVFSYFHRIDKKFSPYKKTSEVSMINDSVLPEKRYSKDMQQILALTRSTQRETNGYFNVFHRGRFDPSGLVKGWAIQHAAKLLQKRGFRNFFIDAGGDIAAYGHNDKQQPWRIGIRNPFSPDKIVKLVALTNAGIATSGTYIRGSHIYNPLDADIPMQDIVSLTVIGPTVYDADRLATAAYAMGKNGITFIEQRPGYEGYLIDKHGAATMTNYFERHCIPS